MRKLYEKKEILFAVLWIVAYCVILGTIRGNFGDESIYMLLALLVFTAGIIAFVKANHLEGRRLRGGMRAKNLGAKNAYVLSDIDFYQKHGFERDQIITFYWKD